MRLLSHGTVPLQILIEPSGLRLIPDLCFAPAGARVLYRLNSIEYRLIFAEVFAVKLIPDQHYPCLSLISADPKEHRHERTVGIWRAGSDAWGKDPTRPLGRAEHSRADIEPRYLIKFHIING